MDRVLDAAILGASGYTGGELLRLLLGHQGVSVVYASSREYKGRPLHYAHPWLRGFYKGLRFSELNLDKVSEVDVVFNALPHGVGLEYTRQLYEMGVMVVDLSADYRLKDPRLYEEWYGYTHPYPDLLSKAVYGLPELHREELKEARLIASPGCNATATILSIAPLVAKRLLREPILIISDIKAASSEAGSKPSRGNHHPEREGALRPYSAEGHRHSAEAEQELSGLSKVDVRVSIVPHASPMTRGVFASSHSILNDGVNDSEVLKAYAEVYGGEFFIRIQRNPPLRYPDVKNVLGSNMADVGYAIESRVGRVTGFAAIDNLVRGAAGQAIQAFNIALGFDESMGLLHPPLRP